MKTNRGSAIIAVLLVSTLLLVLGMGLLSQKATAYEAASRDRMAAQARAVAQAGLVDCQLKFSKVRDFPPGRSSQAKTFVYGESLEDSAGKRIGSYLVTIDSTWATPPYSVIQVTSVGTVGDAEDPRARYQIFAELDMSRMLRNDPNANNPNFRKWLHYVEQSLPDETSLPTAGDGGQTN
jgi:type II secretory pathway pseudopilin PulG